MRPIEAQRYFSKAREGKAQEPKGTFYSRQRLEEYKTFAEQYVAPVVQSAKESPVPATGLAEWLAQIEVKPLVSQFGIKPPPKTPIEVVEPRETAHPFGGIAGLIAPAEASAYTVGRLAGLETPRPPPTLISFEPGKAMQYGPQYAAGTVIGDILLSLAMSKGASKIWSATPEAVKAPLIKAKEVAFQATGLEKISQKLGGYMRQHAPEPILKLIYGEKMGQAISIERQWGWAKPSVKGTAGMLEEAFGMPFYAQQSLWQSTPTLEWARVRQLETLASQKAIESMWGWESKFFGIAGETMKFTKEAFEAAESLHMNMPIEMQQEKWFLRTTGYPQTPMEVTLKRAIERTMPTKGWGGLSAIQELRLIKETIIPPSPYTFYKAPVKGFSTFDRGLIFGAPQLADGKSGWTLFGLAGLGLKAITKPGQYEEAKLGHFEEARPDYSEKVEPSQASVPILKPERIMLKPPTTPIPRLPKKKEVLNPPIVQQTVWDEGLKLVTPKPTRLEQLKPFPKLRIPTFPTPSSKHMRKGLGGEWFKRTHMVAPPKYVAKKLGFNLGGGKKSKR